MKGPIRKRLESTDNRPIRDRINNRPIRDRIKASQERHSIKEAHTGHSSSRFSQDLPRGSVESFEPSNTLSLTREFEPYSAFEYGEHSVAFEDTQPMVDLNEEVHEIQYSIIHDRGVVTTAERIVDVLKDMEKQRGEKEIKKIVDHFDEFEHGIGGKVTVIAKYPTQHAFKYEGETAERLIPSIAVYAGLTGVKVFLEEREFLRDRDAPTLLDPEGEKVTFTRYTQGPDSSFGGSWPFRLDRVEERDSIVPFRDPANLAAYEGTLNFSSTGVTVPTKEAIESKLDEEVLDELDIGDRKVTAPKGGGGGGGGGGSGTGPSSPSSGANPAGAAF